MFVLLRISTIMKLFTATEVLYELVISKDIDLEVSSTNGRDGESLDLAYFPEGFGQQI